MENDKNIPRDVVEYSKQFRTKKLVLFALTEVLIISALIIFGDIIIGETIGNFSYFVALICICIPILTFDIVRLIFDKSYFGTVVKVDVESSVVSKSPASTRSYDNYIKKSVMLYIKKDDGEIVKYAADEGKFYHIQNKSRYEVGDRIFHLYGKKHTVILPSPSDTDVVCAVCTVTNSAESKRCRRCGHTLIK